MCDVNQEHVGIEPMGRETLVHCERDLLGTSGGLVPVHLSIARGNENFCEKICHVWCVKMKLVNKSLFHKQERDMINNRTQRGKRSQPMDIIRI